MRSYHHAHGRDAPKRLPYDTIDNRRAEIAHLDAGLVLFPINVAAIIKSFAVPLEVNAFKDVIEDETRIEVHVENSFFNIRRYETVVIAKKGWRKASIQFGGGYNTLRSQWSITICYEKVKIHGHSSQPQCGCSVRIQCDE